MAKSEISSTSSSASQSPLGGFAAGAGAALGQGALNLATTPLNMALSSWQMDEQAKHQKELTDHNAEVTNRLQRERNLQNFSELAQGAEKAGFSPLAALGGEFSSASAASAPMPSATTPQITPPSLLEVSQARLLQAQAKKVENENEDTEGTRKTLALNLPVWFENLAKNSDSQKTKDWYNDLAKRIRQDGTVTQGALNAYLDSTLRLNEENLRVLRDTSKYKLDTQVLNNQLSDVDVKNALVKLPADNQQVLWETARKLASEKALNIAKVTLSGFEAAQLEASANLLVAEWAKLTNSDYNTALSEGRFADFLLMMAGTMANGVAENVGEVLPVATGAGALRKAGGKLTKKFVKDTSAGYEKGVKQTQIFRKGLDSNGKKALTTEQAKAHAKRQQDKLRKSGLTWQEKQRIENEKRLHNMDTWY